MYEFKMPSLGADMEAGRLIEWRVRPGDPVTRGQVIVVVDTDKAAIEVEIWKSGTLREILIEKGAKVPVGTVLARVEVSEKEQELGDSGSTPEKGIPPKRVEISPIQAVIARAMETSNREIPHYYLSKRIEIDAVLKSLEAANQKRSLETKILLFAPLLWALIQGLKEYPELNGHYREGHFVPAPLINPALVISLRSGGSLAPAMVDAGALSPTELMARIRDLVDRTREGGGIRSSEFSEGSVTVTNLIDSGVHQVFGVIFPPQVALIGIGTPYRQALETDGGVTFRTVIEVTLSGDHRVSDGRVGAAFLKKVDQILQQPERFV
jgi:pyruvate dehydrogenase E2 component (dihydrolipoamide acetyltransferase)